MFNAQPIQLLNDRQVFITENTIGNTMKIAKIPERLNEARLSSFISFVTGDNELAGQLTVQERYYILLNYLALTGSNYSANGDYSEFYIHHTDSETPTQTPNSVEIDNINITHLYGNQAMLLEQTCENVYEWLAGQIAMQCYGDIGALFGKTGENAIIWEKIETTDSDQLSQILQKRFEQIEQLTDFEFQQLAVIHETGCNQLAHLVDPTIDNHGIILFSQEKKTGDGANRAARFRPLSYLPNIVKQLAQYIV